MRSLNFETVEVSNGLEAIESLRRDHAYDVVTINREMPVMDGIEFVDAVRQDRRFRTLRLLMISSEGEQARVADALKRGVDEYLVKPCTLRSVAQKLELMGVSIPEVMKPLPAGERTRGKTETESSNAPARSTARSTPKVMVHDPNEPIRVMLIDDSAVVRRVIKQTLEEQCEGFKVVGAAKDGLDGLEMIDLVNPEAILLDVDMPRMDGLELLRHLRTRKNTIPVVMFSSRTERGAKTATDALLLGARDFVFKPGGANMQDVGAGQATIAHEIAPRLRWLTRRQVGSSGASGSAKKMNSAAGARGFSESLSEERGSRVDLVVIAASTGGPAALAQLTRGVLSPAELSAPILIAQHMPTLFTKHLAERLANDSGLDIQEAVDGEVLEPGMIRLAPGGRHAAVKNKGLDLVTVVHDEPPVNSCRPSADVLFLSAAEVVKHNLLAIVLTGMGSDSQKGCAAIQHSGGTVWVQDEASSVIWGMPGSVVKAGLANRILSIDRLGSSLIRRLKVGRND